MALKPRRPTDFTSPTAAIPVTTTQKISGAMIILISRMKPSPMGLSWAPKVGQRCPMRTPATTAMSSWKNREVYQRFLISTMAGTLKLGCSGGVNANCVPRHGVGTPRFCRGCLVGFQTSGLSFKQAVRLRLPGACGIGALWPPLLGGRQRRFRTPRILGLRLVFGLARGHSCMRHPHVHAWPGKVLLSVNIRRNASVDRVGTNVRV